VSFRRPKQRTFLTRALVELGQLIKPRHQREQPAGTLRCSRCGYVKGPRTVLVPADQCPSCGGCFMVT
jgi:rubrerythrin